MTAPGFWSVRARNLPEHAGNVIHTDAGARAAGFPAAIVGGVTTYAYMVHPIVQAWGMDWVESGTAELRFDRPVFADDELLCSPTVAGGSLTVHASVDGDVKATVVADRARPAEPRMRNGGVLPSRQFVLAGRHGADYALRAGDDLDLFVREGVVHPAVWPDLANKVFSAELVRGPWIHLRSSIRHHARAAAGATADVHAVLVDRFQRRSGERAVVDVIIEVDGRPVASLEHEAIIALADRRA